MPAVTGMPQVGSFLLSTIATVYAGIAVVSTVEQP